MKNEMKKMIAWFFSVWHPSLNRKLYKKNDYQLLNIHDNGVKTLAEQSVVDLQLLESDDCR